MVAASELNGERVAMPAVVNAYAGYCGAERAGNRVIPGAWALAGSCGTKTLATIDINQVSQQQNRRCGEEKSSGWRLGRSMRSARSL